MNSMDLRVYVVTARLPQRGRDHLDIAAAAIQGGAGVIQFRDKKMSNAEFEPIAARIGRVARDNGVLFFVNDRVEIAIAVGAHGVHVGRNDPHVDTLRQHLPKNMILGASATNYDEAIEMNKLGADYLGVGPVFPTGSKSDAAPAIGVAELARICRAIPKPVVAIGGINSGNLRDVIEAGADGAAVIAAVAEAEDMVIATAELKSIWDSCSRSRAPGIKPT